MNTPASEKPRQRYLWLSIGLKKLLGYGILLLAVIGLGEVYDKFVGDGPLAGFVPLSHAAPQLLPLKDRNTTGTLSLRPVSGGQSWQALKVTRDILSASAPEVSAWLTERQAQGEILYDFVPPVEVSAYQDSCLSYQSPLTRHLFLAPRFWLQTDGAKAMILVHEYRHSRQNFPKVMAERLAQVLSGSVFSNPNATRLEDEAFLYQRAFLHALGQSDAELNLYLNRRGYPD